jgi:hypothetical protein
LIIENRIADLNHWILSLAHVDSAWALLSFRWSEARKGVVVVVVTPSGERVARESTVPNSGYDPSAFATQGGGNAGMTKREVLLLIANASDTCAAVTVIVHKDHVLITSCPPVILGKIMDAYQDALWRVSVADGGLDIRVTG